MPVRNALTDAEPDESPFQRISVLEENVIAVLAGVSDVSTKESLLAVLRELDEARRWLRHAVVARPVVGHLVEALIDTARARLDVVCAVVDRYGSGASLAL